MNDVRTLPSPLQHMHIIANRDPFDFAVTDGDNDNPLLQSRWHTLLENFTIVYYSDTEESSGERNRIKEACQGNKTLSNLKSWLREKEHANDLKEDQFIQHFATLARSHYESIWQSLSLDEQLALFHLARDRFIHIHHPGIPSLLQRGIIRFDPDLRLMNTTFRDFVKKAAVEDGLENKETEQTSSVWSAIKRPLTMVLGSLLLFFLITQQEFRAALPALLTFIPILIQSFSDMPKKSKIT